MKMVFISKQKKRTAISSSLLLIIFSLLFFSCKKDSFITNADAKLGISTDSLKYDTVFTSTGSVTQSFKINNNNNQKLLLSSVKLMGGAGSEFKINVNGIPAQEVNDIEVAANDSMYVFVTVTINPSLADLPFLVKDSIRINYNGNTNFVQLEAYGQNAHFLRNTIIKESKTWTNDLPYVILGGVRVDTNVVLTIDLGCKIYSHADAPFIVDGSFIINGTKDQLVIFTGDRLDETYRDFPASWPGIYFRGSSRNNLLNFTTIKNAYRAIVTRNPSDNANPKVQLHQCMVDNAYDAGILCVNSSLFADNSLISNCGSNINIILGGIYNFTNCTVASYSTFINHKQPVLSVNNFAMRDDGSTVTADLTALFTNCIFRGEDGVVTDEVQISKQGGDTFSVLLDHCLYKTATGPANTDTIASVKNKDPMFDSINVHKFFFDFHTTNVNAPGIDKGTDNPFLLQDLDGNNRKVGKTDIGCYEKQ